MAKILDGKKLAESILAELKRKIAGMETAPRLSAVLCGEKPESVLYTDIKKKKGGDIGINVDIHKLPESASQKEVIDLIKKLNKESDGIIIQLPLPEKLKQSQPEIIEAIDPAKDVDGLTSLNLGKTLAGEETFVPATPKGIIRLLESYKIPVKGKNITIINHSNLLGKPLAAMLINRNATVTVCNEFTRDLAEHTKNADIFVTGAGKPGLIRSGMVKENAVVVDVGISKKGRNIEGDVDFEDVKKKASYITPVPGGVGPMTVAMLMENVLAACKSKISRE